MIVDFGGHGSNRFREKSKALFGGIAVVFENVRQNDGICKAVRRVVHATKAMSNGVDVTDEGSCECKTRKVRSLLQVFTCFDVVPVVIGILDIFDDEAACNNGGFGASVKIAVTDVRFDGVRQRIHACCCCKVRRQIECDIGVENR